MITFERVPNPNYTGQPTVVPTVQVAKCCGPVVKTYTGDADFRTIVHTCQTCGTRDLLHK